jgi:uncharacterized MAPEG superfamily protein
LHHRLGAIRHDGRLVYKMETLGGPNSTLGEARERGHRSGSMSELTCLELSVVLWLVHVLVQASFGNAQMPFGYLFTSRDKGAAASGVLYGRATRALANYVENFTPFVAVVLALIVTQRTGGAGAPGATIWILARTVYLPIYVFGIIYVRTIVWGISIIGLVMMLSRLIGW